MSGTLGMGPHRFELVTFNADGRMTEVYIFAWPRGSMCAEAKWDEEKQHYAVSCTRDWPVARAFAPTLQEALKVSQEWCKQYSPAAKKAVQAAVEKRQQS